MLLARPVRLHQLASVAQLCHFCTFFSDSKRSQTSSAQSDSNQPPSGPYTQETLHIIQSAFANNPGDAAEQISHSLSAGQRALLAAALSKNTDSRETDEKYVDELFEAADIDGDKGALNKVEFQHALEMHRALDAANIRVPPDRTALKMVFIAAAIPFIGFGFLDNFIMLVAGEEIDHVFGARLGLSTLASAGLGNLVADVIGVGAANGIESRVKKLPFIRQFKLSKHQVSMPSVRATKAIGASTGVMLGCVLGLAPLFWSGTFFVPGGRM